MVHKELFEELGEDLYNDFVKALDIDHNTYTPSDIWEGLINRKFSWLRSPNAVCIVCLTQYPQCKAAHIFLCAGDLNEIVPQFWKVEKFARENGCDRITAQGRLGWSKVLKSEGFESGWSGIKMLNKDVI